MYFVQKRTEYQVSTVERRYEATLYYSDRMHLIFCYFCIKAKVKEDIKQAVVQNLLAQVTEFIFYQNHFIQTSPCVKCRDNKILQLINFYHLRVFSMFMQI